MIRIFFSVILQAKINVTQLYFQNSSECRTRELEQYNLFVLIKNDKYISYSLLIK